MDMNVCGICGKEFEEEVGGAFKFEDHYCNECMDENRIVQFYYTAGYCGTDTFETFIFGKEVTDREIQSEFDVWFEDQRSEGGMWSENEEDFN